MTALALPVMVGAAGLATDTVQWMLWQRQLQQQADAAALAGAYAYLDGTETDAERVAGEALAIDTGENLAIRSADTTIDAALATVDGEQQKQVSVGVQGQRALPFSSLFVDEAPVIAASSRAGLVNDGENCIITLGKRAPRLPGILATGSTSIDLDCGMATNAKAPIAISGGGSAEVRTTGLTAVGGIAGLSKFITSGEVTAFGLPQPDPYASVRGEPPNPCTSRVVPPRNGGGNGGEPELLLAGCYDSFDLGNGRYVLEEGRTYYINGPITMNGGASLTGRRVTLVLAPNVDLHFNGSETIDLTAPTTGEFRGIAIFQRYDATATPDVSIFNGGSNFKVEGAIYMPNSTVRVTGNSGATARCTLLVADRVEFSGNSGWTARCRGTDYVYRGLRVRLLS